MGAVRLELRLTSQSEWLKLYEPRDATIFVPTDEAIEIDTEVRVDLDVGGWQVALRGTVVSTREDPNGVIVAALPSEREKLNYVYAFSRGGVLNLRRNQRLPIRLPVTYGAIEGPAKTFTRDINEEGLFLLTDKPLPETSQVHMLVTVPGRAQPLSLMGKVSHTILAHDEEPPGMGIIFELDEAGRQQLAAVIKELVALIDKNALPDAI